MAEIYFAATGPLHWMKEFEDYLKAQTFTINAVGPSGQNFSTNMSGLLEPIQLYRFIVPEPAMPLAIRTLKRGKTNPKGIALPIFAMRKALGLDEVRDIGNPNDGPILPVPTEHMQIVLIGEKKDEFGIVPTTGTFQEKV